MSRPSLRASVRSGAMVAVLHIHIDRPVVDLSPGRLSPDSTSVSTSTPSQAQSVSRGVSCLSNGA